MKINLEFQYFEGCPSHKKMSDNIKEATHSLEDKIELKKVLVEEEQTAKLVKFRGSPTLLINGIDFEEMPEPNEPTMSCRFYSNGIPVSEEIRNKIIHKLNMEL